MVSLTRSSFRPSWDFFLIPTVFFAALFLYLWHVVEPRLIYHAFGVYIDWPEFYIEWSFLREFLSQPGGPVRYAAAFLSQWYYYSWAGALVITSAAWLVCAGTNTLVRLAGARRSAILCYLPALGILVLYSRYSHLLTTLLALVMSVWFAVLYEILPFRRFLLRASAFLVMFCILYYLAAGGSLLFAVLATISETLKSRRYLLAVVIVTVALIGPWLAKAAFFIPTTTDAYLLLLPFHPNPIPGADSLSQTASKSVYILVPLIVLLITFRRGILRRRGSISHTAHRAATAKKRPTVFHDPRFGLAVKTLALAVIAVGAGFFSFNAGRKKVLQITYCSRHRMWSQLLQTAARLPLADYDFYCNHQVNRALYHTGRLADDMFSFPQSRSALLLFTEDIPHTTPKFQILSDTCLDMGNINLAEQWAHETFEIQGNCPFALEKLALIYIAKEQPQAARVFLNRMSRDLVCGGRARELLRCLDNDPRMADDPQVKLLRSLGWTEDHTFSVYSEEYMLTGMLKGNKPNRMAFEYLMAFYLLTRQPDKIFANLHRLDDFGYDRIPRHYEEALMVYCDMTKEKAPLISSETVSRYEAFVERYRTLRQNRNAAFAALANDFSDTYFFYHIFKSSGVRR
jgi:hypothetical protein